MNNENGKMNVSIAICGIDGSGKTTLIKALKSYYEKQNVTVGIAKVPFESKSLWMQAFQKSNDLLSISIKRIGMAFDFLKYYQNINFDNEITLCDRYDLCYKVINYVDNIDESMISRIEKIYDLAPNIDRYIFLELPPNIAIQRLNHRCNRTEDENDHVIKRMSYFYHEYIYKLNNCSVIDASKSLSTVFTKAIEIINDERSVRKND